MNLDDLKKTWKQRHSKMADSCIDELASRALTHTSAFERKILRRDLIETAAAIMVMFFFGSFLLRSHAVELQENIYSWTAKLGMVIIILGAIELVVVMHWTRRRGGRPDYDLPLAAYCAAEIARVDRQIRLLRNVNWWYTGPLLLGVCLFVFGMVFSVPELPLHVSLPAFAVFCALILIFGWMIYRINQRAVCQQLVPFREELAAISASLSNDSTTTTDTSA